MSLTQTPAWRALHAHSQNARRQRINDLFASNTQRFKQFSLSCGDLLLDYSKHQVCAETRDLLIALAGQERLAEKIAALFAGERVNRSEDRAAIHPALRAAQPAWHAAAIAAAYAKMHALAAAVSGQHPLAGIARQITDVVNIGIGGGYLGPQMLLHAFAAQHTPGHRTHFIVNTDAAASANVYAKLHPQSALFVIVSKTFNTAETQLNANYAKQWLSRHLPAAEISKHFIVITGNAAAAQRWGADADNVLPYWDELGGRYSLFSPAAFTVLPALGAPLFAELRAGACSMDEHFRNSPLTENMPVLMALLDIWYGNFFAAESRCLLVYEDRLKFLPEYIQQLEMESNGKNRAAATGATLDYSTGLICWGGTGSNAQHSFMQALHQGGRLIPTDFIVGSRAAGEFGTHHDLQLANCLAQARALMTGNAADAAITAQPLAGHQLLPGNQPSNILLFPRLTPFVLGQLVALYEHKVFAQAMIWGINPFDQWGVETGKKTADAIFNTLTSQSRPDFDASTNGLLEIISRQRADS